MRAFILLFIFYLLFLNIIAQPPKLMLPIGHYELISANKFSPDNQKILTVSHDKSAKIWESRTGKQLLELKGHDDLIYDGYFFSDGKKILTISADKTVRIWNAISGDMLLKIDDVEANKNSAVLSPDGNWLITLSTEGDARVWRLPKGELRYIIKHDVGKIDNINFSPDSKNLVTISQYNAPQIWDINTGKVILRVKENFPYSPGEFQVGISSKRRVFYFPDGKKIIAFTRKGMHKVWDAKTGNPLYSVSTNDAYDLIFSKSGNTAITFSSGHILKAWDMKTGNFLYNINGYSAAFSPDEKMIIVGSTEGVSLWERQSGKELHRFPHTENSSALCFSSDNKKLIASFERVTKIWDVNTGKLLNELTGQTSPITNAEYSFNGDKICMAQKNGSVTVWDPVYGQLLFTITGHLKPVTSAVFSPDGKKLVTGSDDETVKIWDAKTGNLLYNFTGYGSSIEHLSISPNGKNVLVTTHWGDFAALANIETGKELLILKGHSNTVGFADFSPDGKKIVTASLDNTAKIWDANTGKLLQTLERHTDYCSSAAFSPDGTRILTTSWDRTGVLWNATSGEPLVDLEMNSAYPHHSVFTPDGKKMITACLDSVIRVWNAKTGELLYDLKGHSGGIESIDISRDSRKLITSSWDNTTKVWDLETGMLIFNLLGHNNPVLKASFSPDQKRILTASNDNTCKLWNAFTGKLISSFFAIDKSDYFVQIPSGFYQTTPEAAKLLHYVTKDLKVITFEQLDVKYNRPDKVLEAIGNTDTALIKSYRKAWEKRIKKLGIDTTAFRDGYSVPECDFIDRDNIEYEQKSGNLSLHIKGNDSTYKLDRFNIWINEAPLFGQRGISIKRRNRNDFDTTVTVKLSQGENRIETSITNVNGTESYRMPLVVNYTPAVKEKEALHFIGIGMDKFADSKYNLQYSTKDIRDLSVKLKLKYGAAITIDTLFNENVSVSSIKALKQKLFTSSVNDKVIVAYSGHGMLSRDYDYYLSTWSVNFDRPEENGLPYDELENLLDSIPARKKLMLIDACHSGEVDKDDLVTLNATSDSLIKGLKPVAYKKEGHLGLKNSFELMQSLFVNVGKSTGATIISAAAGTQFALERNDLKNGVFTYSILEAMNKYPTLKISELKKIVGERVEELTKGLQKPTSRNENITVDWELW